MNKKILNIFNLIIKQIFVVAFLFYSLYLSVVLNKPYIITLSTIIALVISYLSSFFKNKINNLNENIFDEESLNFASIAILFSVLGWILINGYLNKIGGLL